MKINIIISKVEKVFDKIQHPFMIKKKKTQQNEYRRNEPYYNKVYI